MCDVPAPLVAGTPETDALAEAPARCGQPAHGWLRDAALGSVRSSSGEIPYAAALLEVLLEAEGVTLSTPPTHDVAVRVLTYETQDRGELAEATTLVAYPTTAVGGGLDVLLFLHGTSGFSDGCGVANSTGGRILAAALASALGVVVVAPDYLGLRSDGGATGFPHPYLVGQATAIAALAAVRAARRMAPAARGNQCAAPRVATIGGSQGGHAALWVDRLAPYYARELELVGGVATVPPADMHGEVQRALTQVVNATGNTTAFLGSASSWYGVPSLSGAFVAPWDQDLPGILAGSCDPGDGITATTLEEIFTPELLAAAAGGLLSDADPWGCITDESGLGTTSVPRLPTTAPGYGLLFVTGEADDLVHTPLERVAYEGLCSGGMPMHHLECAGAGHVETTFWAFEEILAFTRDRLASVPFTPACTVTAPVTCSLTPP